MYMDLIHRESFLFCKVSLPALPDIDIQEEGEKKKKAILKSNFPQSMISLTAVICFSKDSKVLKPL